MEEEKVDTTPQQGLKMSLETLGKEEIINKYKGLLGIAKKAKQAKDEQSITVEVLQYLSKAHINKLFQTLPVGYQATFEHNLSIWISKTTLSENRADANKNVFEQSLTTTQSETSSFEIRPIPSLKTILEDTCVGKKILKYYEENEMFRDEIRVLLINTVAKYIEVKGYKCTMTDCSNLERQICSIFPSETLSYYTTGKRGKLYNKIHNLKRQSKALKEIKPKCTEQETVSFDSEPDSEFSVECLRNETITMDEFDLYWRKCSNYRFNQIKNKKSTEEVLNQWPEYNKPSGYKLIAIDFSIKYPKAKDLGVKWTQYENKLFDLLRVKIANSSASSMLLRAKACNEEIADENRKLREELQQHKTQRDADQKALLTMKEMLEAYTENKLQLTTLVTELQKQRKVDCENLEKLSIENESLQRQLQRLTEDNESLLTDIENMESQLQQVSGFGKEQKQHLILLEKEITLLKTAEVKNQELEIKNGELFKELEELKEKYKFIKDINTEQRQKFNSLKDKFIDIYKKLKKLKECKRILLETQHEYADSISQWQNEIIKASKLLCKELNDLKEQNMKLMKKLDAEQPKDMGIKYLTIDTLNILLKLSENAKQDYKNLEKENFELKQNLGIKVIESAKSTPKIAADKLDQTAFLEYNNIQQENLKLKHNTTIIAGKGQVDSKSDYELSYKVSLKLEDLQKLAVKANEDYQKQAKELQQLRKCCEKLQENNDKLNLSKSLEEQKKRQSEQYSQEEHQELLEKLQAIEQEKHHFQKQNRELENLRLEFNKQVEEKQKSKEKPQEISNTDLENVETSQQTNEEFLKTQKSLEISLEKSQVESQTLLEKLQSLEQQTREEKVQFENKLQKELKEKQQLTKSLHEISSLNQQESKSFVELKDQLLNTQQSLEKYQHMYKQKEIEHRELLDEMRELNEALKARGDLISRQQEDQHLLRTELITNGEKLAKIQQELEEKDKQLNIKQSELETIIKDIETTKQKIEVLETSSNLNEEKVRVLSTELETLKTNQSQMDLDNQSDVLSTSTISRADELQRLRDIDDSFEDKYNKLRGLAAKLKKKLQEETCNKQRLEKELQDLKTQENNFKIQLEDYRMKISEMDSLQKQLNENQKHIDSLKTENLKLKSSRKQANVLNLEIEAAEKSLTEVTNKLANRTLELDAAQESLKSKESTITQLRKEIDLLESSKFSEVKHSQELKEQIDHLQKTTKDEMYSKQQAYEQTKILEQDVENLKQELENVKIELAQTTSNQELTMNSLKTEKEQLSLQLTATQESLTSCEQKLKQTERTTEDLRVEYLDYKVKAQAVLRKNQTRDSSKERELEEELINMRATETQLNTTIQSLTAKFEALKKEKDLMLDDNNILQKRSKELMLLIEELRSQNDSLTQEIHQHIQQQHDTLKQHGQQIESMDNCHKEQLQTLNASHQRQLGQLRKELTTHVRLPTTVGATKSTPAHHSTGEYSTDQSKLDFIFMEREDAEGSEEAAETLATLAASRKISNASSSRRSNHDFMPLEELLNTPMNVINSETLINNSAHQQQVSHNMFASNSNDLLQSELNTTKERLQKQESRVRHLTALLAENEQDLAKLTQMNDMLKEELRRQERSVEREQHMHNSEYVKNVIMKFLTLNNADEKTRLVPVLNTILKLSRSETEMLNCVAKGHKVPEPAQRSGGWGNFLPWGGSTNNNNNSGNN